MSDLSRAARPVQILIATLVAIILHGFALWLLPFFLPEPDPPEEDATTVTPVNLVEETPEEPEEEQQVVSLDKPDQKTPPPDKAKLLDRYNQKVEQETVRKRPSQPGVSQQSPGRPQPPPKPSQEQVKPGPQATSPDAGASADPKPTPDPQAKSDPSALPRQEDSPEKAPVDEDSKAKDAQENPEARSDRVGPTLGDPTRPGKEAPGSKEVGEGPPQLNPKQFLPNMDNMLPEGSDKPKDYLEVPEGEKDLLNRKQTRYWAFFDRMKTSVRRKWNPLDVYRLNDPQRQIYGVEDRLTVLKVTLNGDGSLRNLFVEKPSGVPFLDDEAMRAFRAASPFPNPPEGLKDKNGQIDLRFGFFLDIQSRGSRIIRFRR